VGALITGAPGRAWLSIINGRPVIEAGALTGLDLPPIIERHERQSQRMLREAGVIG
jgi:hypothetical protein